MMASFFIRATKIDWPGNASLQESLKEAQISIHDLSGRQILASTGKGSEKIDVSKLQSGVYTLRFQAGDVLSATKLIINR